MHNRGKLLIQNKFSQSLETDRYLKLKPDDQKWICIYCDKGEGWGGLGNLPNYSCTFHDRYKTILLDYVSNFICEPSMLSKAWELPVCIPVSHFTVHSKDMFIFHLPTIANLWWIAILHQVLSAFITDLFYCGYSFLVLMQALHSLHIVHVCSRHRCRLFWRFWLYFLIYIVWFHVYAGILYLFAMLKVLSFYIVWHTSQIDSCIVWLPEVPHVFEHNTWYLSFISYSTYPHCGILTYQ